MKRFQSVLCTSLLTIALASTALAGNISGAPNGNISGVAGNISGVSKDGNISGTSKDGNISGIASPGNISGVADIITFVLSVVL